MSASTEERLLWLVIVLQVAQAVGLGFLAMEVNWVKMRVLTRRE